ncbi:hypothetical protein HXY33_02960 [Candidatus Bathyarchaeota archaeon]|nr:hypothetical protein [Candidatus Bathyarchaeota archaeon]
MNKKQLIEATVNKQFEKLKTLEILLEKKRKSRDDNFQTVRYALVPE